GGVPGDDRRPARFAEACRNMKGRFALVLMTAATAADARAADSAALQIASLDRKIADLEAEEQTAKRELADLGPAINEARARVVARGKAFYKLTRTGMLPIGGGFDALVSHAMRVERARRSLAADVETERK